MDFLTSLTLADLRQRDLAADSSQRPARRRGETSPPPVGPQRSASPHPPPVRASAHCDIRPPEITPTMKTHDHAT